MADTMTSRERILNALRGEEVDRFPVWLKMGGAWVKGQPAEVQAMSGAKLTEATGCDLMMGAGFSGTRKTPHVTAETHRTSAGVLPPAVSLEKAKRGVSGLKEL